MLRNPVATTQFIFAVFSSSSLTGVCVEISSTPISPKFPERYSDRSETWRPRFEVLDLFNLQAPFGSHRKVYI
ncbi:hypothetical protein AAG906_038790 [Vitis piasezkii]